MYTFLKHKYRLGRFWIQYENDKLISYELVRHQTQHVIYVGPYVSVKIIYHLAETSVLLIYQLKFDKKIMIHITLSIWHSLNRFDFIQSHIGYIAIWKTNRYNKYLQYLSFLQYLIVFFCFWLLSCLSVPDEELFSKRRPLVLFCFRLYWVVTIYFSIYFLNFPLTTR